VVGISAVNLSADLADVTSLDSASNYEHVLGNVLRSGEVTFSVIWDPDNVSHGSGGNGFIGRWEEQSTPVLTVIFPNDDLSVWQIDGIVSGVSITAESADVVRAEVTVKTTGVGTFTQ